MSTRRRRASGDAEERAKSARSKSRAASSTPNEPRRGDVGRSREGGEDGRLSRRPLSVLYASLFVIWGAVLYHGEVYSHVIAQRRCLWPRGANGTRVMVTADPQLVDEYTYRELGRGSRALAFAEAVCDAYVRRTMKVGLRRFAPRNVVLLGDLFGQGARRNEDEWRALRRASTPRSGGRETAMVGRRTTPSSVIMTLGIPKSFDIIPESSHGSKNGTERVTLSSASAASTS